MFFLCIGTEILRLPRTYIIKQNLYFEKVRFEMKLKNYEHGGGDAQRINVVSLSQFHMDEEMDGFQAAVNACFWCPQSESVCCCLAIDW